MCSPCSVSACICVSTQVRTSLHGLPTRWRPLQKVQCHKNQRLVTKTWRIHTCQVKLRHPHVVYCLIHSFPLPVCVPEAQTFGTMLVAYGYIYPLQNHRKLVMCNDTSLYRFQVKLNPCFFFAASNWNQCCWLINITGGCSSLTKDSLTDCVKTTTAAINISSCTARCWCLDIIIVSC